MKNARVFLLALTAIVLSIPAFTQVATGTPSFGSFAGGPDVVNLGNLNADWTIPIRNKAGRGMNFVYNLQYDSSVFYPVASGSSMYWQPVGNWGWQGLTGSGFPILPMMLLSNLQRPAIADMALILSTKSVTLHTLILMAHIRFQSLPSQALFL